MSTTTKIDKYEAKLGKIPAEVREVAEEWLACAMRRAEELITALGEVGEEAEQTRSFWADRIYIHRESARGEVRRWEIADNHERCASLVYHVKTGRWLWVPMFREAVVMKGGHAEALANAEIIWHG